MDSFNAFYQRPAVFEKARTKLNVGREVVQYDIPELKVVLFEHFFAQFGIRFVQFFLYSGFSHPFFLLVFSQLFADADLMFFEDINYFPQSTHVVAKGKADADRKGLVLNGRKLFVHTQSLREGKFRLNHVFEITGTNLQVRPELASLFQGSSQSQSGTKPERIRP